VNVSVGSIFAAHRKFFGSLLRTEPGSTTLQLQRPLMESIDLIVKTAVRDSILFVAKVPEAGIKQKELFQELAN
jgi:hypothetical protein